MANVNSGDKKISAAVIKRLPRYYRYLSDLIDSGATRVSSKELSETMNTTASQIRQDLSNFGCFGQQGYGYNVVTLYEEIKNILGLKKLYSVAIIGAGNLGQALFNYSGFGKRGFYFVGMFDIDESVIGKTFGNVTVTHLDTLSEFLKNNDVDIAALTIPSHAATEVSEIIFKTNIKGIWNFSHADLDAPEGICVENVHLTDSLMILSYRLKEGIVL